MSNRLYDGERRGWSRREFVWTGLGAIAAPVFVGCSNASPTEPGPVASRRFTSRPGIPTLAAPPGRSALGLADPRDGFMYVPSGYSPDNPAPLFVALHGAGGSSDDWSGYITAAEARGFVLLAPDSRTISWAQAESISPDVEFIDAALQHTFDRCRIDPAQIAMGGFSDGSSYALSLGVSNGDLLSHLIGYSPGFHAPSDPIVGKPRVFISHGTQDTILPVSNTRDVIVPRFQNADYDVTYEEFAGGHEVPAEISEAALDWFLGVV